MLNLTYFSLIALCLGVLTSPTILAAYHILIAIPSFAELKNIRLKSLSKSSWCLIILAIIIILSIVVNYQVYESFAVAKNSAQKVKYFLIGFFSIFPLTVFFHKAPGIEKKIRVLLYLVCITATFTTIVGIISMQMRYNFITHRYLTEDRNAGLSGMILNYAHNLAYFQIIVLGMIIYNKELKNLINRYFLVIVFAINLAGLYLTYTRGAILALLAGIPIFWFKRYKLKFAAAVAGLLLFGVCVFFISPENLIRPGSDKLRLSQWEAAFAGFKERPLLGYGYLNFEKNSKAIKLRNSIEEPNFGGHAHNNELEMLASTGLIGFTCYALWLIFWFIEMFKREDVVAKITLPFIIVFFVSGSTQATISLGFNLFFVLAVYSISQAAHKKVEA